MQISAALAAASRLSNEALVKEVQRLASATRGTTATLVAHLAELESRRLHLAAGYPSLFAYCTEVLRLSEHEAYHRIEAARLVRRFPIVLQKLAEGSLTLTTARLLSSQLTEENRETLLAAADGKSKREVEILLARMVPAPDVPPSIRKVPTPRSVSAEDGAAAPHSPMAPPVFHVPAVDAVGVIGPVADPPSSPVVVGCMPGDQPSTASRASASAKSREVIRPLAADRYEIRFTASAATREKLQLASDLLRHAIPDGDVAEIVDRALTALLEELARKKFAATARPVASGRGQKGSTAHPHSRHVPATVKRAVWLRDGGRCAFVVKGGGEGRRCGTRGFLEFHHVHPYAEGGEATVGNIELRCRAHNDYESELFYGSRFAPVSKRGGADERRRTRNVTGPGHVQLGPDRVDPSSPSRGRC